MLLPVLSGSSAADFSAFFRARNARVSSRVRVSACVGGLPAACRAFVAGGLRSLVAVVGFGACEFFELMSCAALVPMCLFASRGARLGWGC